MIALLAAFALVALVSCSSKKEKDEAAAVDHNEADIIFSMTMIPYLEEAVELAAVAQANSQDERLRSLAQQISQESAPVISEIAARLVLWDVQDRKGSRAEIAGLVTAQEMAALEAATGETFDQQWSDLMIDHLQDVVELADTELQEGVNSETRQVARKMAGSAPTEIVQIQQLAGSRP